MRFKFLTGVKTETEPAATLDPRVFLLLFIVFLSALIPVTIARPAGILALAVLVGLAVIIAGINPVKMIGIIGRIYPAIFLISLFQLLSVYSDGSGQQPEQMNTAVSLQWVHILDIQIKSILVVMVSTLLIQTLSFTRILLGFSQMRFPKTLISVMYFIYKYIYLLWRETNRLNISFRARYVKLSLWKRIIYLSKMGAVLITRVFNSQEVMYEALVNKGFRGEFPFTGRLTWQRRDTFWLLIGSSLLYIFSFGL